MTRNPQTGAAPDAAANRDAIHPLARPFLWVESPVTHTIVLILLALGSAGLGVVDFLHDRHDYVSWAEWRGFYAWFGFASFAFAVLCGWPLRALLGRDEDYYEKGAGDE